MPSADSEYYLQSLPISLYLSQSGFNGINDVFYKFIFRQAGLKQSTNPAEQRATGAPIGKGHALLSFSIPQHNGFCSAREVNDLIGKYYPPVILLLISTSIV